MKMSIELFTGKKEINEGVLEKTNGLNWSFAYIIDCCLVVRECQAQPCYSRKVFYVADYSISLFVVSKN
jgi:hypothetical protein